MKGTWDYTFWNKTIKPGEVVETRNGTIIENPTGKAVTLIIRERKHNPVVEKKKKTS